MIYFFLAETVFAADVSALKIVQINSQVAHDDHAKVYKYQYKIANSATNTGEIEDVQMDISLPPSGMDMSADGLIIQKGLTRKGKMLTASFKEAVDEMGALLKKRPIPVGGQAPTGWSADLTVMGTFSWGVDTKKVQIKPGQTASGFIVVSRGLPAIRDVSVRPEWVLTTDNVSDEDIEKTKTVETEISYYGKAIGPTAPPADFQPLAFLDYIVSLKHQAYDLGWIVQGKDDDKGKKEHEKEAEGTGIMRSLDEKLEKAREWLEKEDNKEAVEKLRAFIHEVDGLYKEDSEGKDKNEKTAAKARKESKSEQGHHEHITSEAYALLKYNAQYLIDRLGVEKKERKGEKD